MAAHPGRILDTWHVDEAHVRDESFRLSPAFAAIAQQLSASVAKASAKTLPDSPGATSRRKRR
jgi:hypothetical protein